MARAIVVALVLLVSGLSAGTAVAHDGRPPWWHWHHGHTTPTTSTTTTTGDDEDGDSQGRSDTTTAAATTTAATTTASDVTTTTATATGTTTTVPTTTTAATAAAPAPVLDKTVAVAATAGAVNVRRPGQDAQALTTAPIALPTGTRVDTRHGEVALTSAVDAYGTTQTGRFSGGVFEVRTAAKGYTQLVLIGGHWAACATKTTKNASAARHIYVGGRAVHVAKKKKPIRSLWGQDDHGRFQTQGSGSVATVRGTRWLTEDSCAGTRTTVAKGAVDVRSRRTGKTHRVTAGHSLFVPR